MGSTIAITTLVQCYKQSEYQVTNRMKRRSERHCQVPPAKRQSEELYRIYKSDTQSMQQLVEFLRDTEQLGVAETGRSEYTCH